jgi:hypothetical protein
VLYGTFEIDKPHRHNENFVGAFLGTSLLWSPELKTTENISSKGKGFFSLIIRMLYNVIPVE